MPNGKIVRNLSLKPVQNAQSKAPIHQAENFNQPSATFFSGGYRIGTHRSYYLGGGELIYLG
jgi:hypothetical protein